VADRRRQRHPAPRHREEFGQCARFTLLLRWRRRRDIDEAERLRQPSRAIEKALGLLGHIGLLQMVNQLR